MPRAGARRRLRSGQRHARAGPEARAQRGAAERARGVAQLGLRVRGHDRQPQPRRALGHVGRQHGADVDALLERAVGDPQRQPGVADHERDDVRVGAGDLEALARELGAQQLRVGLQLLDPARLLAQQLERRHRGGDDGRGRGGGGRQRARVGGEVAGERAVAGRERAVGAERGGERADDDVDLALEAGGGDRAAPVRADGAEAVRLADHDAHVVAVGERDDLLQRGAVAVEREHAVGHDQRRAAVGVAQAPREVLDVAVVVEEGLRAREAAAVGDRGVAEAVGEHDLAALGERRDDPEVGEVAGAEQQRALGAEEVRERAPRAGGAASSCPRPSAGRPRRRPSAWRRPPPPRAPAGGRPARGGCPSTAAARAARRGPRAGPAARSPSACADGCRAPRAPPAGPPRRACASRPCGCAEPTQRPGRVWARATVRPVLCAFVSPCSRSPRPCSPAAAAATSRAPTTCRGLRDLQRRRRDDRLSEGLAGRHPQGLRRRVERRITPKRRRRRPTG